MSIVQTDTLHQCCLAPTAVWFDRLPFFHRLQRNQMPQSNSFGAASTLKVAGSEYRYYALEALEKRGANVSRIPYSIRILLENLLRTENGSTVKPADIDYVAQWKIGAPAQEINFSPARVLLQDFTGVPCVVDL